MEYMFRTIISIKNDKILSSCPEPFMNISLSIPNKKHKIFMTVSITI